MKKCLVGMLIACTIVIGCSTLSQDLLILYNKATLYINMMTLLITVLIAD